jgi:ribose transport system permease protein
MNVKVVGILVLLVVLCLFMAVMTADPWYAVTDSTFLLPNNIENLLRRTALYGILGIGVAFVIIAGGIDLSIGSVVCLSGCLLAILLQVDYRAFDHQPIFRLLGPQRLILTDAGSDAPTLAAGDRVRYSGGRRAANALLTIENVDVRDVPMVGGEPVLVGAPPGGPTASLRLIRVREPLSADDRYGEISKAFPVTEVQAGRVVLAGDHSYLRPRDQLVLVHPTAGIQQITVRSASASNDNTRVELADAPGRGVSTEWLAIPLQRRQRTSIPLALTAVLSIALCLGSLHGLLVTQMKLQPFVVTLCGLLIYRGVARWLVSDQPVGFGTQFDTTLRPLGAGKLVLWQWETSTGAATFGIPYPFFLLLGIAVVAGFLLNQTIWGRYLLALGRNEEAAIYSGINTRRMKCMAFIISTLLAAVGGMLFALDTNSVSPSSFGNFFELYAIAAAVLGGCSLRGGEGTVLGVMIGTAVMQVLYNVIVLMRIPGTLEFAIIGTVILLGVLGDELVRRLAAQRR